MGAAGAVAGAQAGLQLYGAYEQSQSIKAQGQYQKQQAEAQAVLYEMTAKDVKTKGRRAALSIRRQAGEVKGSQRAALAAQGIDISSGSALDVLDETQVLSEMDALTAKNNAWREAFGYQVEASKARTEGNTAYLNSRFQSKMTLLTGGLQAAGTGAQGIAASRGGK